MAATHALIRRGIERLHLIALPTSTLQADLLIGASCVDTLETSAVSLGEFGPAPRFVAAIRAGLLRMKERPAPRSMPRSRPPRKACRSCRCAA
jgi:glutaconate CoA-transferase subunit A